MEWKRNAISCHRWQQQNEVHYSTALNWQCNTGVTSDTRSSSSKGYNHQLWAYPEFIENLSNLVRTQKLCAADDLCRISTLYLIIQSLYPKTAFALTHRVHLLGIKSRDPIGHNSVCDHSTNNKAKWSPMWIWNLFSQDHREDQLHSRLIYYDERLSDRKESHPQALQPYPFF